MSPVMLQTKPCLVPLIFIYDLSLFIKTIKQIDSTIAITNTIFKSTYKLGKTHKSMRILFFLYRFRS